MSLQLCVRDYFFLFSRNQYESQRKTRQYTKNRKGFCCLIERHTTFHSKFYLHKTVSWPRGWQHTIHVFSRDK